MVWTLPIDQLPIGEKTFATDTIRALVFVVVDIALVVHLLQDASNDVGVSRFSRPKEVIVRDLQTLPRLSERCRDAIHVSLGFHTRVLGGLVDLLPVFVGAGQKKCVIPREAVKTNEEVRHHRRVGMTHMGLAIDIVQGC